MPTDDRNVLFDDRTSRNNGVLSQKEIDRLLAPTENEYQMDPDSEYYNDNGPLFWGSRV